MRHNYPRALFLVSIAILSSCFSPAPSYSFPFQPNTDSIAYWFNTRRYSNDPTFRFRAYNLYDCKMNGNGWKEDATCNAYGTFADGTNPSGNTCKVTLSYQNFTVDRIWFPEGIGGPDRSTYRAKVTARVSTENSYCHSSLEWF